MDPIYEGKSKRLFEAEGEPDLLLMEFKDTATAFNAQKKAEYADKGRLNCAISTLIYRILEKEGVPTHFVAEVDEVTLKVLRVDILGVEVIVRNAAAGNFCRRTGVEEGREFSAPVVEFSLKSDALGDPLINDDYIRELGLATPDDLVFLRTSALTVNRILRDFFARAGLRLIDFKLEYGRPVSAPGTIVLADEISPDGCRLWDIRTGRKMDKDRFREDLGDLMESYAEVLDRARHALES